MDMNWLNPSIIATLISSSVSASVSLWLLPKVAANSAHARQTRSYIALVADTIRDFRESAEVLATITSQNFKEAYPLTYHISKLGIPDELIPTKVVVLGDLSEQDRQKALWLTSILVNINRDVATILRLIERDKRLAFDKAVVELGDKFSNLANRMEKDHVGIQIPLPSGKPKTIQYEDGTEKIGRANRDDKTSSP